MKQDSYTIMIRTFSRHWLVVVLIVLGAAFAVRCAPDGVELADGDGYPIEVTLPPAPTTNGYPVDAPNADGYPVVSPTAGNGYPDPAASPIVVATETVQPTATPSPISTATPTATPTPQGDENANCAADFDTDIGDKGYCDTDSHSNDKHACISDPHADSNSARYSDPNSLPGSDRRANAADTFSNADRCRPASDDPDNARSTDCCPTDEHTICRQQFQWRDGKLQPSSAAGRECI